MTGLDIPHNLEQGANHELLGYFRCMGLDKEESGAKLVKVRGSLEKTEGQQIPRGHGKTEKEYTGFPCGQQTYRPQLAPPPHLPPPALHAENCHFTAVLKTKTPDNSSVTADSCWAHGP